MKPCPFCAEDIREEAVVCRFCNRELPGEKPASEVSVRQSISTGTALGVIALAILLFGGLSAAGFFKPTGLGSGSSRQVVPQTVFQQVPVVTRAEYGRLYEGMTYREAVATIGAEGEEMSRSDLAGYSTIMYSWTNSNGSNMNAMFQNGKLVTKAQFGLP